MKFSFSVDLGGSTKSTTTNKLAWRIFYEHFSFLKFEIQEIKNLYQFF